MRGVAEQHENSQKKGTPEITVLFAGVAVPQSLQSLGHPAGVGAINEGLKTLLDIVTQWKGDIITRTDDSILACFIDPTEAVKAAIHMQRTSGGNREGKTSLAIRIAIHYGQGTADNGALHGDMAVFAAEAASLAKAGHIYVSPEARHAMQGLKSVEFHPIAVEEGVFWDHLSVFDVVRHPETDCTPGPSPATDRERSAGVPSTLFLYGALLLEGENRPCFYCGSRKHPTSHCPSKQLSYGTCGLEALGHLTMDEINRLFSTYLAGAGGDLPANPESFETDKEDPVALAPWSFYELKRAFQLRFLNIIWSASPKEDWYKVKENKRETSANGGLLWLARDCIRMSELDEAEDFLERYARQNSKDYRTACGLGFVHIEWGSYTSAADCLTEALSRETTPVQKTYLLLLLSRIYSCAEDHDKALRVLKKALRIEPYCLEARFEEIVRYFQLRQPSEAESRLLNLLHLSREYYVAALISPELAEFQSSITPEFHRFVMEARTEAQTTSQEADKAVAALKGLLRDDDEGIVEMVSMQERMHGLLEKPDALLACQDAVHTAKRITADCSAIEKKRKDHAVKMLLKLEERVGTLLRDGIGTAKLTRLVRPVLERLRSLKEELERREPFDRCLEQCEALARDLDPVEAVARRLKERARLFRACGSFFKDLTIIVLITAATELALLPVLLFCVSALRSGSTRVESPELWLAQKAVFVVGGLFAVIFALGHTIVGKAKPDKKQ
jgi:class 3 adenylate cyclase/tetratricopeptide (TPR) repeat protein